MSAYETHRTAGAIARAGVAVAVFAATLAMAWTASATLLLIFAGLLLGVFLDGLTRGLRYVLPVPRTLRLALASLSLAALFAGLIAFGGATVAQQAQDLGTTIQQQSGAVRDWLTAHGIAPTPLDGASDEAKPSRASASSGSGLQGQQEGGLAGLASGALKNAGSLLSEAGSVLGPALAVILEVFNVLGNGLVIAFLGLAFAADPGSYRDGLLHLVPPHRRMRAGQVLDQSGETLRHWLFGQLVTMLAIFLFTWAGLSLIGVGAPLILGLQAGLLAFVPTVGPLVAGLVILLASLASGPQAVLGAIGVYLAVQTLESYVLTPLIQKRALDIPPATIFSGQLLLGVLFGLWGIALALPLMAVIKVLLARLYVEDVIEAPAGK